ncbi:uncharacterized protein B0I36DRAFT_146033 [Microdochium trichocladiopsis]|uniref:Uncharacterized protein n=1 Tax=Microdochium trichocladiopsis TaxID=1682393 RepID=A0A9P9BS58_9PEZI|nr:uncharacterized protein B0I36DRAFT_146033 [Microdochium trichocladiopsis]KAH7027985.1 hypothetical protein B0I36DRAFT_146033 [Microdochium trichocladiopsis]
MVCSWDNRENVLYLRILGHGWGWSALTPSCVHALLDRQFSSACQVREKNRHILPLRCACVHTPLYLVPMIQHKDLSGGRAHDCCIHDAAHVLRPACHSAPCVPLSEADMGPTGPVQYAFPSLSLVSVHLLPLFQSLCSRLAGAMACCCLPAYVSSLRDEHDCWGPLSGCSIAQATYTGNSRTSGLVGIAYVSGVCRTRQRFAFARA